MAGTDTTLWVTVREAAERLGKSERTIRRWIAAEKLRVDRTTPVMRVDIAGHVYDNAGQTPVGDVTMPVSDRTTPGVDAGRVAELEAEVTRLSAVLAEVRDALQDARTERDDWKAALAENMRQSQRLLEHVEADQEGDVDIDAEPPGGLLRRFGRWLAGDHGDHR